MRRAALALLLAAVAGCGGSEEEEPARTGSLTVVVRPQGEGGRERARRIGCPGSDLCGRIARTSFDADRGDVACTDIYGGPATATAQGTVAGRRIDASFSLRNGCEIARWERFAWLLGPPPPIERAP